MRGKNGVILTILFLVFGFFHPVATDYLDKLQNEAVNHYIENVIPETITYGDLLTEIAGNEVVIGTLNGILVIMDHDLEIVFSINLGVNARKAIIDQLDEDSKNEGLFVLTEDGTIRVYNGLGTELLSLSSQAISDFIVINVDDNPQKEIVTVTGSAIESYNLSGEKLWNFHHDSDFKKIIHMKELGYFGGFAASTCNEICIFSYNGGYICNISMHVREIMDFFVWERFIFILGDNNQIFKIDTENMNPQSSSEIYPHADAEPNIEYISDMYLTEYGIVAIGLRGQFQVLSFQGDVLLNRDLGIEIVGFDCVNLDDVRGRYIPQGNFYITSPEFIISTQTGRIHVYVLHSSTEGYHLEERESYLINRIRKVIVFPSETEVISYKLLSVDLEGKIHSYNIFSNYCDILTKYNAGLVHYRNHEYHESELLLREIADPKGETEVVNTRRKILEHYGLLKQAEKYLENSKASLSPLVEEGKAEAAKGYRGPDYEMIVEHLFLAYVNFARADTRKNEIIYEKKTLEDLINDIRYYILLILNDVDDNYEKSKFERALQSLILIYPKMETLMEKPLDYVEEAGMNQRFWGLVEKYPDIEEVRKTILDCMNELDTISEDEFIKGNLKESKRLNDLLINAAKIIRENFSRYESRNVKISKIYEDKKEKRLKMIVYFSFGVTVILIAFLILDKKVKTLSERRDYIIFSILIAMLATLALIGMIGFLSLSTEEQIENLRYISSSLIQGYVAILAIVPGIILALMSFFASRYPPHIAKKIWKSKETALFFLAIAFGLAICCFDLISLNKENLVLKMVGEIFSIGIVLLAIFLLADRIQEIFDMNRILLGIEKKIQKGRKSAGILDHLVFVLCTLSNIIGRKIQKGRKSMMILDDLVSIIFSLSSDIKRKIQKGRKSMMILDDLVSIIFSWISSIEERIQEKEESRDISNDLVSIIYILSEDRDLKNLDRAINDLFDFIINNESYFNKAKEIFLDILVEYKKKNMCSLFESTKEIIKESSQKIERSNKEDLIKECRKMVEEIDHISCS